MHRLLLLLPLLFLLLLSPRAAWAQAGATDFRKLDEAVAAALKETKTPGAAVAVVSGERVVYAKGFGVADSETGRPVTADTLFRIGSTTKIFTALTLLSLAEEGKIRLDRPVGEYAKGLTPALARLTAAQLLSHTAGMIDVDPDYGPHDESALGSTVRMWGDDFVFTEPGHVFSYSNEAYDLLGYVIEQVGGKPYARQVRESVIVPLGIPHSAFRLDVAMTYPFSQGHELTEDGKVKVLRPFPDNVVGWPNGFLFSSAADLARLAVALLNGGKLEGKQVIPPDVLAQMFTPHADIPVAGRAAGSVRYGYGMQLSEYRGTRLSMHDGALAGFTSIFRMAPERRFALVALGNLSEKSLDGVWRAAFELMVPAAPPATPNASVTAKHLEMTAEEMKRYTGRYVNNQKLACELFVKDGKLFITFTEGEERDTAPVAKVGELTFVVTPAGEPPQLPFLLIPGADGRIEYLHTNARAFRKVKD
ncbi:MAG TPA: serine hydrolase domain-containing protein [Pyrinomonadaceae bacterium]|nr:serine hydrolase domain-containing protein [Pyrinomonadaceae bacterium]